MLMFKPPILLKVEGLCASRPDYDVKGSQQNQEKLSSFKSKMGEV
jgi:hypothetical protein